MHQWLLIISHNPRVVGFIHTLKGKNKCSRWYSKPRKDISIIDNNRDYQVKHV